MKSPTTTRFRPVIRVFVSSTFSDLIHERDALQQIAWPELERVCQHRGFQFQAIDLRWGVPTEAGLDHRTMRICFEELQRSQEISPEPNFLILLGNRYGWRPLPESISESQFSKLNSAATVLDADSRRAPGTSEVDLTGDQVPSASSVLNYWYIRDENNVTPVYVLRSRSGTEYEDKPRWKKIEIVLWRIINCRTAFPPESFTSARFRQPLMPVADRFGQPAFPEIVRFQASATEQEIWGGALSVEHPEEHVLACFRRLTNLADFQHASFDAGEICDFVSVTPDDQFDTRLSEVQEELKAEIQQRLEPDSVRRTNESRCFTIEGAELCRSVHRNSLTGQSELRWDVALSTDYKDSLRKLCDWVIDHFKTIIDRQMDAYLRDSESGAMRTDQPPDQPSPRRALEIERQEHERFAELRGSAQSFVGRSKYLRKIIEYVSSDSPWPLVMHGASGCGKTALLARAAQEVARLPVCRDHLPIVRFISVTPRSSDLRSLLSSLCQELRERSGKAADPLQGIRSGEGLTSFGTPLPTDIRELMEEFRKHLSAEVVTAGQPIILFLDALDQLSDADSGRQLFWIPFGRLPSQVKLILSCLSDRGENDPPGQPYVALESRGLPRDSMWNLDALSPVEAQTLLFNRWFRAAGRTLNEDQRLLIDRRLESESCRQPLYLKLLFEETKLWRSWDKPIEPGDGVRALLKQLFDRLSQPRHHGEPLVRFVLGYLGSARRGLSESEILGVLFADPDYRKELHRASLCNNHTLPVKPPRIPVAIWSRLRSDLSQYLTEVAVPGGNALTFYHRQVAEYVRNRYLGDTIVRTKYHLRLSLYFGMHWSGGNQHAISELCYHETQAGLWSSVEKTLCDLQFIEAKCRAGLVHDLLQDYSSALDSWPDYQRYNPLAAVVTPVQLPWQMDCVQAILTRHVDPHPELGCMTILRKLRLLSEDDRWTRPKQWQPIENHEGYKTSPGSDGCSDAVLAQVSLADQSDQETDSDEDISTAPKRANRFALFVSTFREELAEKPAELVPLARNHAEDGLVVRAAEALMAERAKPWLETRNRPARLISNPVVFSSLVEYASPMTASAVALSDDGHTVITGSSNGVLKVWDVSSGRLRHTLAGHSARIERIAIVAKGCRVVSLGGDETIRQWDAISGTAIRMTPLPQRNQVGIPQSEVRQELKDRYEQASHTSLEAMRKLASFELSERRANTLWELAVTPDGRLAVTIAGDNTYEGGDCRLDVWDLERGTIVRTIEMCPRSHVCPSITPDGRLLVTANQSLLTLRDLATGEVVRLMIHNHSANIIATAISRDGRHLFAASSETIVWWDVESGQVVREWNNAENDYGQHYRRERLYRNPFDRDVAQLFSHYDNGILVTVDGVGTFRMWDLSHAGRPRLIRCILPQHAKQLVRAAVTPDCRVATVVGAVSASKVEIVNFTARPPVREESDAERAFFFQCALTADGLALTDRAGVWDLSDFRRRGILAEQPSAIIPLAVSLPDRETEVSPDRESSLDVWGKFIDPEPMRAVRRKLLEREFVKEWSSWDVTPDGRLAVKGYWNGSISLGDPYTSEEFASLPGRGATMSSASFTPDGRCVLTCDGMVRLWSIPLQQCVRTFETAHFHPVISPDGRHICAVSSSGHAGLWDVTTGVLVRVFHDSPYSASQVGFTPDARFVLCVTGRLILVWAVETGELVLTFPSPVGMTSNVRPDGQVAWTSACGIQFGRLNGLTFGTPVVTAIRLLSADDVERWTARCPWCGRRSRPPLAVLEAIQRIGRKNSLTSSSVPCLEFTPASWEDTDLMSHCVRCCRPQRFNPFALDTSYVRLGPSHLRQSALDRRLGLNVMKCKERLSRSECDDLDSVLAQEPPDQSLLLSARSVCLLRLGQHAEALSVLEELVSPFIGQPVSPGGSAAGREIQPSPTLIGNYVTALLLNQKIEKADEVLTRFQQRFGEQRSLRHLQDMILHWRRSQSWYDRLVRLMSGRVKAIELKADAGILMRSPDRLFV